MSLDNLKISQRSCYNLPIQYFEADFLWKVSLKNLNSGIILKTFTHALMHTQCIITKTQSNQITVRKQISHSHSIRQCLIKPLVEPLWVQPKTSILDTNPPMKVLTLSLLAAKFCHLLLTELQKHWTHIWSERMSDLIWIQTV